MKKVLATLVSALVAVAFAGVVFAEIVDATRATNLSAVWAAEAPGSGTQLSPALLRFQWLEYARRGDQEVTCRRSHPRSQSLAVRARGLRFHALASQRSEDSFQPCASSVGGDALHAVSRSTRA